MIDFHLSINQLEFAGAVCAAVLVVFPLLKSAFGGVKKQIGRLSLHAKILLLFCIVDSIIVCGTKTNEPPRSAGVPFPVSDAARCTPARASLRDSPPARGICISLAAIPVRSADFPVRGDGNLWSVTPEDIARGYCVESIVTNEMPFAAMPSNAVEYSKWYLRGGRETWFPLDLGDFVFPLGTNFVNRLCVISGGMVETYRALNGRASICAAREYASLVPGVSRFWSADADDGAKVLRWENVFANRDRTGEYSAGMRLFPNGDFTTRSNEVETVFRRVNPYDWDGDGIANEIDNNPQICDGDFFGIANQLPTNANPNAYYWLDLAATGALGVAKISVVCNGPSDLGDHNIIARTNQVCHIPLLAGAAYTVESDLPISYSAVSSEYAQIETNSEKRLTVALPLEFSFERIQTRSGSDNYTAHTTPVDVLPKVLSVFGACCTCSTNETGITWSCNPDCQYGGYERELTTAVSWEGYSGQFTWCGSCPCIQGATPDAPVATLAFSPQVVLFEEAFTNAYGQKVESQSTITRLSGSVYGGEYGGTYSFVVNDCGNLEKIGESYSCMDTNVEPYACHDFWIDYRAKHKSDSPDDITATITFIPAEAASPVEAVAAATSVEVMTFTDCRWIPYMHRKELGVGERVTIAVDPEEEEIPVAISGCCYTNLQWRYTAPASAGMEVLAVSSKGAVYSLSFTTIEPESIAATDVWCDANNLPGVAGNFAGCFDLVLLPTNVSFQAVLTAELGYSATNAVGFFALPEHIGLLDHSLHGANNWHGVGRGNQFFDTVSFKHFHPPWGNGGAFTWPIENAWKLRFDTSTTNRLAWRPAYDQRFELDADGTARIKKFDYTLQQGTNLNFQVTKETR